MNTVRSAPNDDDRSPLSRASDAILAARIVDGDVASFEVLVRRHGPLMRAYAAKLLGSTGESDDVVQDAFLLAWQRMADVADGASVRAWLMRIVTNRAIDRIRARPRHTDIPTWDLPASENRSTARVVEDHLEMEALVAALNRLPATQHRCWVMREVGGSSYDEIADQLGLPPSTVRGQLARARHSLVHEMEAWR
ncbi:MAG TPA: RNA polymerase sigma factor [Lacisediminihabitans sp.]|uniref:RNA polymerase sigma factor n=1 Tax=Lacisediminihabitans sp. TaxID=2787631 RepID=UPI002ED99FE8